MYHRLIIRHLIGSGPLGFKVSEVARALGVSRSAVYDVVWRLQAMRMVKRRMGGAHWRCVGRSWACPFQAIVTDYEWFVKAFPDVNREFHQGKVRNGRAIHRES